MKKLGPNSLAFNFNFPRHSPTSVTLQPGDDDQVCPVTTIFHLSSACSPFFS